MPVDCLTDEPSHVSQGMFMKVSVISDEGVWSMVDGLGEDETSSSRNVGGPLPNNQRSSCFDRLALVIVQQVDLKQSGDQTISLYAEISPPNLLIRFGGFDEANLV